MLPFPLGKQTTSVGWVSIKKLTRWNFLSGIEWHGKSLFHRNIIIIIINRRPMGPVHDDFDTSIQEEVKNSN